MPVGSGETGELVVTNLSIEGSPVIRFRTGDAARFVSHRDTGSGRAWDAIECGTIGRIRRHAQDPREQCVAVRPIDSAVFAYRRGRRICRSRLHQRRRQDRNRGSRSPWPSQAAPSTTGGQRTICSMPSAATIKERTNMWMTLVICERSELPEFSYKARRWKDERQQGYRL